MRPNQKRKRASVRIAVTWSRAWSKAQSNSGQMVGQIVGQMGGQVVKWSTNYASAAEIPVRGNCGTYAVKGARKGEK